METVQNYDPSEVMYFNGDKERPIPPTVGMNLGVGSVKVFAEWIVMYNLVVHKKSVHLQRGGNCRSRCYNCKSKECKWSIKICASKDKQWHVSQLNDVHENCDSVANPSSATLSNILRNSIKTNERADKIVARLSEIGGIDVNHAGFKQRIYHAKNKLLGRDSNPNKRPRGLLLPATTNDHPHGLNPADLSLPVVDFYFDVSARTIGIRFSTKSIFATSAASTNA